MGISQLIGKTRPACQCCEAKVVEISIQHKFRTEAVDVGVIYDHIWFGLEHCWEPDGNDVTL